ncbi:FAD/NAD(P)-binding domain-containing protein [Didymella exigua CBS 183.55]|uniref:FAD/NAD(P)-binding domain-containing protein n=1 Tax=Didymella exigua CBS 183.55 TaxID=1150837 RepID=A0A6A5RQB5_9PLEO|nr:FAD/NAD(P)-binding domain-containing protein [Didymella exigua CBS 183.55]KAF1927677.1 FAD/NAD(P)-binding domain-containing protein [Didymella exigua CBS 183.55]
MQIIIVGAGLAGLSTALALSHSATKHHIILLESASALAEIGAGVQLTPIATRQFKAWGLESQLLAASALPKAWNLRRGSDGQVLNRVPMDRFEEWYGAPYVVVHRADLHRILHEAVVAKGVEVRLNSRVQEYGTEEGWVQLLSGENLQGDLVVACDGINSLARSQLLKSLRSNITQEEELEATGWAAYRLMADVGDVKQDPLTREVVDEHAGNCWADTNKSVMTYMISGSGKLNLVLSHPDDVDTSTWTREQYLAELQRYYSDVDSRALRLINLSNGPITNWPVHQVAKLPAWASQSGRFLLIGDAAHAMAFYLSMGVSLAIEDATALTTALELCTLSPDKTSLAEAIRLFEKVRKPRVEKIRDASLHAGAMLHLPPGVERSLRDESARCDGAVNESRVGDALLGWISYGITDKTIREDCYGYDVVAEMRWQAQEDGTPLS